MLVWGWHQRFAEAGAEGLLRDETRKPGRALLSAEAVRRVLASPCTEVPSGSMHQ
jgi:hypothetical protein